MIVGFELPHRSSQMAELQPAKVEVGSPVKVLRGEQRRTPERRVKENEFEIPGRKRSNDEDKGGSLASRRCLWC